LLCSRDVSKLNSFIEVLHYDTLDFVQRNPEKFSPRVDHIQFFAFKCAVERGFKSRSVFGENQSMDIEVKWYGSVTKLIDSFHRF